MSRDSAYYDDQSKGGGGYKINRTQPKNNDQEALNYLGAGFGAAGAAATAAMAMSPRRTNEDRLEAADKAKRESDAEMKRESRGVQKPANFDAIEEAKRDAKDRADAKKQEKAYNESLTTENKAKGGMTAKYMSFSKTGKPDGMKSATKMASGGMTASSRADGCCTKGKTRGKMV